MDERDRARDGGGTAPCRCSPRLRFAADGGKVIVSHGWADDAISASSTVDYYQRVVAAAGRPDRGSQFIRLYGAPAVNHTGGGPGASGADLLGPLDDWVDNGTAPGDLVAYRASDPNSAA